MSQVRIADHVAGHRRLMGRARPLEREEEAELARRWQSSGDQGAANELLRALTGQVLAMAAKYRRYGTPINELVAEGNFGLVQALRKFDPARGRLSTYAAHWIRACILAHVIKSWSLVVGCGVFRSQMFFRLRRERALVTNVLGEGEAADSEIARRVGTTPKRVRDMLQRITIRDVSLDASLPGGSTVRFVDLLPAPDNQEQGLFERQAQAGAESAVHRAVADLDPRERYIALHRLLAESATELSLADIARHFGVSRERARQLETRTKSKLRARIREYGDEAVNEWIAQLVTPNGQDRVASMPRVRFAQPSGDGRGRCDAASSSK